MKVETERFFLFLLTLDIGIRKEELDIYGICPTSLNTTGICHTTLLLLNLRVS